MNEQLDLKLKETVNALKKYVKEKGDWPKVGEWNKYAVIHSYYTANTLQYLNIWGNLSGAETIFRSSRKTKPPKTPAVKKRYRLNRKSLNPKTSGNVWAENNMTNLRKARKALGLSIAEVAKQAGLSKAKLGDVELKLCKISNAKLEVLAKILGADLEFIKEGLLIGPVRPIYLKKY